MRVLAATRGSVWFRLWYVGDGQSGVWRWVFANAHIGRHRWLWMAFSPNGPVPRRFVPGLPQGYAWNVRKDQDNHGCAGLYARHDS